MSEKTGDDKLVKADSMVSQHLGEQESITLYVKLFTKALPIGIPSLVEPGMDELEEIANTPLGRGNDPEDPEIIIENLAENGVDASRFSQYALLLYKKAGEPKYEKDQDINRTAYEIWRDFISAGEQVAVTALEIKNADQKALTPREMELTHRMDDNIMFILNNPAAQKKYPEILTTLAKRTQGLYDQIHSGSDANKREYLELKLELEKNYLQHLIDNLREA